ncbi:F-box protein At5g18160-like [Bidens hawaiensis]|uniref:F-box protein At5g18160-like n=1 Tax=Bidens hawaiensis TaxID=980011 RepID=UPI00404AB542
MADANNHHHNIPFEIIKRVSAVKSLIQFRSVSKRWKAVIDGPEFIADHSRLVIQTQPPHMLALYNKRAYKFSCVSIVDDDTFPHHKFSPAVPPTVRPLWLPTLDGSAHGLVCFVNCQRLIVVWNPSIRKSVGITLSSQVHTLGFGVCAKTFEPKIVKIVPAKEAAVLTLTSHGHGGPIGYGEA